MKKLLKLLPIFLLLQPIFGNSLTAYSTEKITSSELNFERLSIKKSNHKTSLKHRILLKFKSLLLKQPDAVDKQKKTIKLLGIFSLSFGLLGVLSWLLAIGATWATTQVLLFIIFLSFPLALILGIISLVKRKKSSDKKEISKIPALIGVILGGAGLLLFLIGFIILLTAITF